MKCPKCSADVPAGSNYCDSCGAQVGAPLSDAVSEAAAQSLAASSSHGDRETPSYTSPVLDANGGSAAANVMAPPEETGEGNGALTVGSVGTDDFSSGPGGRAQWPSPHEPGSAPPVGQPRSAGNAALSSRFFGHSTRRTAESLTDPTRYLCAAAYLESSFARNVTGELLATHRAVAPSVDIDLGPIVRHCIRARQMALVRDIVLTILLLVGLYLALLPMLAVVAIAFGLAFLRGPAWQRRSVGGKATVVAGAGVALVGIVALIALAGFISHFSTGSTPSLSPFSGIGATFAQILVILVLVAIAEMTHAYVKYRTLSDHLRPGEMPRALSTQSSRVEARVEQVEGAQWGNVTLYSGANPFVGTGKVNKAWSIAVELNRARPPGAELLNRPAQRAYVPIDSVELHTAIRKRVLRLNDPHLPENERIAALMVEHHVVGEGLRRWDGPLIDPRQKVPYSLAGQEAIEALMRHPQAGMRYYQRISVGDKGLAVMSNGQEVIGGADQEVAVSAYVYVAVEGRMLYVEFVTTVLPPIRPRYHIIDHLPLTTSGPFLWKVIAEAATTTFGDLIGAIPGLIGGLRLLWHEQRSFEEEATASNDYVFGDVGTRASVRELGSSQWPHTHIQALDVAKYTKIIERLLTDTVLDFLHEKGVDITAFARSAASVVNAAVINYGNMSGPVAASSSGPVTQSAGQQEQAMPVTIHG